MTKTEAAICARVLMGITRVALRSMDYADIDLRLNKIDAETHKQRIAAAFDMHHVIGRLQFAMFDRACLGEMGKPCGD